MLDRLRSLRSRPFVIAAIIVVFGALVISWAHVWNYPQLSPVDELQHIDYLYKAPAVVHTGDKVGQDAMHEQSCRILPNYPSPPCSDTVTYVPTDFQEGGSNTASVYTPVYYTVTKVLATPLTWVLGSGSLVTAARLVGGVYLAAGLLITLLIARRLGALPYPTAAILLAASATPNLLLPSATITPDAVALLMGAALVWSVLWWEESPTRRWWLPASLAMLTVLCKAINILVVLLVALFIVLRYAHGRLWPKQLDPGDLVPPRPGLWRSSLLVVLMSGLSLAGSVGYVLYARAAATASPDSISMGQRAAAAKFPVVGFIEHLGVFLQVFYPAGSWVTTKLVGSFLQIVIGVLVFAGTFAAAFLIDRASSTTRLLSIALLVVGLVGAPLIIAMTYVTSHIYVPIPGRYALTLIPAGVATAASAVHRRPAQLFIGIACVVSYVTVLAWLFIFPM